MTRFEIAQCASVWSSLLYGHVDAETTGAAAQAHVVHMTKWFGGKSAGVQEGQIMRTHRKGCAVVACFGHRLKNAIGIKLIVKSRSQ